MLDIQINGQFSLPVPAPPSSNANVKTGERELMTTQWIKFPDQRGYWWMRTKRKYGRVFHYDVIYSHGENDGMIRTELGCGESWKLTSNFPNAMFHGPILPPDGGTT